MVRHPKAGQPVKIANGPLRGQYFIVSDYFVNQYQGKDIARLRKTQAKLLDPVAKRGYPIDDQVVFGKLYPKMNFICVHEKELLVDMKVIEGGELPPNVTEIGKHE